MRTFVLLDEKRFKILSWALISLQLFSVLFFAEEDFKLVLSGEYASARNRILYADVNAGRSIFRTVAGVASYYYCFNVLLFFYSLAFRNDNKLFLYLLIGTSISRIFHSLTYVGRDGVLFWILSFLFSYFLFLPYLKKNAKILILKMFAIFGTLAIVLILLISLSRFGSSDLGPLLSIVDYFGQPLNNFGMLFDRYDDYRGSKSLFQLLYGSQQGGGAVSLANAENFYARYGFYSNSFFTFIGNFYRAWGPLDTLFVSIIYSLIMSNRLARKRVSMSTLIILMFSSQIILHNYFYWAYSIRVANLFIFTLPLFVIYCGKSSNVKQSHYSSIQ